MIFDTNVFIDYFRGLKNAQKIFSQHSELGMSVVSYYEILQGIRNKTELKHFYDFLQDRNIQPLLFDEKQSLFCRILMEKYCLSHGLRMTDAMIASCCITHQEPFTTANIKDFRFLKELTLHSYR